MESARSHVTIFVRGSHKKKDPGHPGLSSSQGEAQGEAQGGAETRKDRAKRRERGTRRAFPQRSAIPDCSDLWRVPRIRGRAGGNSTTSIVACPASCISYFPYNICDKLHVCNKIIYFLIPDKILLKK